MSYHEARILVANIGSAVIFGAYCLHAGGRLFGGSLPLDDPAAWAGTMLVFVAAAAVLLVLAMVAFSVAYAVSVAVRAAAVSGAADPEAVGRTVRNEASLDEMGRLIELRSSRIGAAAMALGGIAALALTAAGLPVAVGMNAAFAAGWFGAVAEGFVQLADYRKGVARE